MKKVSVTTKHESGHASETHVYEAISPFEVAIDATDCDSSYALKAYGHEGVMVTVGSADIRLTWEAARELRTELKGVLARHEEDE